MNPNNTKILENAKRAALDAPKDIITMMSHQRASDQIKEIQEQLSQIAPEMMPRLPEDIFANWFVPLFAGEVTDPADKQRRLIQWLEVSGNPFKEVRIIDSANHSVTLFNVPPLYDRTVVKSHSEGRHTLGHIMRSAEQYSGISPHAGRRYLAEQFMHFDMFQDIESHRMEFAVRWNEILVRYGRKPITQTVPTAPQQEQANIDEDDDPLVF